MRLLIKQLSHDLLQLFDKLVRIYRIHRLIEMMYAERNLSVGLKYCLVFLSKILTFATTVAKHTSNICNVSREASSNTTNPMARRHFVQSAKDVANATAELVRKIKVNIFFRSITTCFSIYSQILDGAYTQENHRQCIEITRLLLQSVDELHTYAMSKEFASIPATISSAVRTILEISLLIDVIALFRVVNYKNRSYPLREMSSMVLVVLSNVRKC